MWCFDEGSSGWMSFSWIWFAVFWGIIIAFGIWIIRKLTGDGGSKGSYYSLDIAKQRYAKGEISREEFEEIKKDISL